MKEEIKALVAYRLQEAREAREEAVILLESDAASRRTNGHRNLNREMQT